MSNYEWFVEAKYAVQDNTLKFEQLGYFGCECIGMKNLGTNLLDMILSDCIVLL